ncbi:MULTISPECIES: Bax inhibitor-1/YccA family protein [Nitratidesulfovibrio]|uniref:Bax inhibitor-1/YccA family protein n=1 Tax=Nitratidesulfovibrio liaohensis TaxID=2604158 RepID=A0ABY9R753_9BACT|nr:MULTISPECIES: Bax inhibitor-1/YccA family protein [Nitratidesulfovibrio]MBZ2173538.1 Bax inhibitor-1/YccA family protein [Nitratidesulfovibrio sp. SRB-5]RXF78319.1 Bax inhibitor-1/YccA family protein [Desulfovibrio sp. DS-1]WMW66539.1 Bax inhibitor-1/YccA family protein [Nitratidesulfovibrio liaohensis]
MLGRTVSAPTRARAETVNAFMRGVYNWMFVGLAVTAGAAWFTASSPAMLQLVFGNSFVLIGLILAELGLVMGISAGIARLSGGAATGLFVLYSALNGITLSAVLLAYTAGTVFQAFATAAGMFGAMSLYGLTTKKDLTSWGSFLFMGLIGILIASVVNIFVGSSAMSLVISAIGVIVFTGLTAYDSQKLRMMGETAPMDDATAIRRGTILGALTLYLDFINLFLMLLRLFGSSRD